MSGWADFGYPNCELSTSYTAGIALLNAMNERGGVVNEQFPAFYIQRLESLNSLNTFITTLENALNTRLIPKYINHTINNGDFTGLDEIPMWTVESIYEYLNETRINPQEIKLVPSLYAKWARQKYRVINLLRWVFDGLFVPAQEVQTKSANNLPTWNNAINAYNAQDWEDNPILDSIVLASDYSVVSDTFFIAGQRGKALLENNYNFSTNNDLYMYGVSPFQRPYFEVYEGLGLNKYLKVESNIPLDINSEYLSNYYEPLISPNPQFEPTGQNSYGGQIIFYSVQKFDTINGFKFRGDDW